MKRLETVAFDQMLLMIIKENYKGTPLLGSRQQFADFLNGKDVECDRDIVRRSLERLQANNLISHKWTGKYFETKPIPQVAIKETAHRKEKKEPVLATSLVYRFYDLFKDFYHDNNYVTMEKLASMLNVSKREIRSMKRLFNMRGYSLKNGNTFKRKILGNNNGYTLISNESQKKEARWIIVNKLLEAVDELEIFDEDMNLDDQLSYDTRTFKTKLTKSISNDLDKEK